MRWGIFDDISRALYSIVKPTTTLLWVNSTPKWEWLQNCSESVVESHGSASRNHRGQILVNFLEREGLILMNSFFKQRPQKSERGVVPTLWPKIRSDSSWRTESVYSETSQWPIGLTHVHWLVRGSLNIYFKIERIRLMKSRLRPTLHQVAMGSEKY